MLAATKTPQDFQKMQNLMIQQATFQTMVTTMKESFLQ